MERQRQAIVDWVKRRAITQLHRTARGEALLLELYLFAERGAEGESLAAVTLDAAAPAWLRKQAEHHLADERRHAGLLERRLLELGFEPSAGGASGPQLDRFTAGKLAQLRAIGARYAPRFQSGARVPVMVVAHVLEKMGVRVMERHASVLTQLDAGCAGPTAQTLASILADERRHVLGCAAAVRKLTLPGEQADLAQLYREVEAVERQWAIAGAFAMLAMGIGLRCVAPAKPTPRLEQVCP
jgi:hypothetical protein